MWHSVPESGAVHWHESPQLIVCGGICVHVVVQALLPQFTVAFLQLMS
jgi:hypothetical protein